MVVFVMPKGSEDEIHLDKDGSERQDAAQKDVDPATEIPGARRDLAREFADAAWVVWRAVPVLAQKGAKEGERERDEGPDEKEDKNGIERNVGERGVGEGDNVEDNAYGEDETRKQRSRQDHILDPVFASIARIVSAAAITCDKGSKSVANDKGRDGSAAIAIISADHGKEENKEDEQNELMASANQGREGDEIRGRAKDFAVDLLPTRLVDNFAFDIEGSE